MHSYEVDPRGALAPRVLCAYLQEVAGRHAAGLGVSMGRLRETGLAWVLRRLRVEAAREIRQGERLLVETWPSGVDGVMATREFEIRDESGELVGVASSQWVVVNVATRTVVRLPAGVGRLAPAPRAATLKLGRGALPTAETWSTVSPVVVRRGDLDVVGHVNNTRYVEWLWESLPDGVWERQRLVSLEIVFLGEARHGDRVLSRSVAAPREPVAKVERSDAEREDRWIHSLVDAQDRELARAITSWARA